VAYAYIYRLFIANFAVENHTGYITQLKQQKSASCCSAGSERQQQACFAGCIDPGHGQASVPTRSRLPFQWKIQAPSNTWFLENTQVYTPNGISIG